MANTRKTGSGKIFVALMRGINVGGKNKLPMQDLAALFAEAGCRDVRTYIQSGNVVFGATPKVAKTISATIVRAVARDHGLQVPVVIRTADELRQAARSNPFLTDDKDPKTLHVGFLADRPSSDAVAALDPDRSPGDRFEVEGREIYFDFPNGVARTKLTNAYFDSKLATVSTMRNWRTLLKLVALADAVEHP